MGYAMLGMWALPGLVMLPIAGAVGDEYGLRWGMIVGLPLLTIGALIVSRGKDDLRRDIDAAFQSAMAAIQGEPSSTTEVADPSPDDARTT